jgi:hypothetical protein
VTDPVEALINESAPTKPTFTFGGETFEVINFDLRVKAAAERGREGRVIELMIGKEAMDRLLDLDTDEQLTQATVIGAMRAWAAANGTSTGESTASTAS